MNELLMGLLVIAAVVLLGLALYNRIEERRFRRKFEADVTQRYADPLQATEPAFDFMPKATPVSPVIPESEPEFEPEFHISDTVPAEAEARALGVAATAPAEPAAVAPRAEPRAEPAAESRAESPAAAPVVRPPPVPRASRSDLAGPQDAVLDFCLTLDGNGIRGSVFADAVMRSRRFHRPVQWWGLEARADAWRPLQPWRDVAYEHLIVAVQLANRNGATSADDLTVVCALVEPLARQNKLHVRADDIAEAAARAQRLDALSIEVDLLIGLNVVARDGTSPYPLDALIRSARDAGLKPATDGSYQRHDANGELLFQLVNYDAEPLEKGRQSAGVTLQFDVPRVADGIRVFDEMVNLGVALAEACDGQLVDDALRPLTEAGVAKIQQQLARIYQHMADHDIAAGSPRALRLFS